VVGSGLTSLTRPLILPAADQRQEAVSTAVQCPRCQHENLAGAKFCNGCGARLELACPACKHTNPVGSRFCNECGAPLGASSETLAAAHLRTPGAYTPKHLAEKILTSKAALEGERKQVTVLFADLKGSMELLADRDPEEARKLLDPVLERMMEAVHRYEGTVNQVMGDGIRPSSALPSPTRTTPCAPAMPRSGCRSPSGSTRTASAGRRGSPSRSGSV